MRVIENEKTMRVMCICSAELEIMATDLKKEPYMTPSDPTRFTFHCPICRQKNHIMYGNLDENIKMQMLNNN